MPASILIERSRWRSFRNLITDRLNEWSSIRRGLCRDLDQWNVLLERCTRTRQGDSTVTTVASPASLRQMTRVFRRIFVAAVAFVPVSVVAQEPLTVGAAVQAAIAHNASLRASRAGLDEAAARTTEARSGFYPRLSVGEAWQRGDEPVFVFGSLLSSRHFAASNFAIDALNHPEPIGFFHTTFGVEQLIYDGGRQRAAAASASLGRDIAAAAVDQAAAGIALQTTQTFGRLIASEAAKRAADAGL